MANDPKLGARVKEHLNQLGLENPLSSEISATPRDTYDIKRDLEYDFRSIMTKLGLDLSNDSIVDTPKRVAKMFCDEIFSGLDYNNFPACSLFKAEKFDEVVSIADIEVRSTCEHHFLPFLGTCTIAYLPFQTVLGLSKFNRIVDFFSRRPQLQERLTAQIAETIRLILQTDDVAVYIKSEHLCTKMRGIKDFQSYTVTSKLMGRFKDKPELRNEFLTLTRS